MTRRSFTPALKLMETGLSSNAAPGMSGFRLILSAAALTIAPALAGSLTAPLAAQDDTAATPAAEPVAETPAAPARPRVNVLVTIPRGDVNQAQAQECVDRADAGTISGEIVVCRQIGEDNANSFSGDREAARKRYAQETMLKGGARAPDFIADCNDQGNPFGCVGFGKAPPPALFIDVEALPKAPEGSDADRIARGLPPLNQNEDLSEEEEKARREAAGINTKLPPRPAKKKKN
jgi:hypothetical protein